MRVYAQTTDCSRNLRMTCKKKSELANYRHDEERNYPCWNSLFLLSSSFSRIFDYDRFFDVICKWLRSHFCSCSSFSSNKIKTALHSFDTFVYVSV